MDHADVKMLGESRTMLFQEDRVLSNMIFQDNGWMRPAPTFSLSDAPAYVLQYPTYPVNQCVQEDSEKSNSTDNSSGQNIPVLDIAMVENTYLKSTQPILSPSLSSLKSKRSFPSSQVFPVSFDIFASAGTPKEDAGQRLRISLDQTFVFPGSTLSGTVFLELAQDMYCPVIFDEDSVHQGIARLKLCVTFNGEERVTLLCDDGNISVNQYEHAREKKELGIFLKLISKGVHEFQYSFKVPDNAAPSCAVHVGRSERCPANAYVQYSISAALEDCRGQDHLSYTTPVIVREHPLQQPRAIASEPDENGMYQEEQQRSYFEGLRFRPKPIVAFIRYLPKGRNQIRASLQRDTVSFSENIVINFDMDVSKKVKPRKASVKLVQMVEFIDSCGQPRRFNSTICVADFELGCSTIELLLPPYNELSPSVETHLMCCRYVIQIKTKSNLGVLTRGTALCLPVRLVPQNNQL